MEQFLNHISDNLDEIKKNFKTGLSKQGYLFDEDVLSDVILKCNDKLSDKNIDKKDSIKYLWVSYINKLKNNIKRNKEDVGLPINFDMIDNEYDFDIDELYNYIVNRVRNEFGDVISNAWIDYFCHSKTSKDIIKIYKIDNNFQYILKKIKKFILDDLKQNNYINNIRMD